MLNNIKVMLGISDDSKDELINILIDNAISYVLASTHRNCLPPELEAVIIQCVIWDYNKLGSEGLNSEAYSGLSYNYQAEYPDNIMRQIRAYRKVVVI